jgi:hypothetical protein
MTDTDTDTDTGTGTRTGTGTETDTETATASTGGPESSATPSVPWGRRPEAGTSWSTF